MNIFQKIYFSIKASLHWSKSMDLASENNYSAALKEILKSEEYCEPVFPAGVIKVLILLKNEMQEEVIIESKKYLKVLEKHQSLNEDEKKYIKYYINDLAQIASNCLDKDWEVKEQTELNDIRMCNVSDKIKRWHPI